MHSLLAQTYDRLVNGKTIDKKAALILAESPALGGLCALADNVRKHFMGNFFHLCSIINARSGNCSEDCRFCAQSALHQTEIDTYGLIAEEKAIEQALDNHRYGVHRLSFVTGGRRLSDSQLEELQPLYIGIGQVTDFKFCASMGLLDEHQLERLTKMGVSRYHCNLETNRIFFPAICTTHSYDEKVRTLTRAEKAGLSLCSGGIIGMGESMEDRIDLAFELRELGIKSIPINILSPIPGTPLGDRPAFPLQEVLITVALFRLINPDAVIRMAGGRQQLGRDQYRCFTAGANGAIVGNYLTTVGSGVEDDLRTFTDLGFVFSDK
jgi:biotin synthase